MRLLLDSHTLLWAMASHPRLSNRARDAIGDTANDVFFSPASLYELLYKAKRGRLRVEVPHLREVAIESGFSELVLTAGHLVHAANLDWDHGDPWDRILLAQAVMENMALVSTDKVFDALTSDRFW